MKQQFEEFLRTLLKELKAKRPSTPFYHDDDGEIDDDRYQEALEVQWDREDSGIDNDIDEIRQLLEPDNMSEVIHDETEWYHRALMLFDRNGYKITISKTF
jgi:hypothetical protein